MKKTNLILVLLIVFAAFVCTTGVASAISLSDIYVGNTVVDLEWDRYHIDDFSCYKINRSGSTIATISDRDTTFYRDTELLKGVTYSYKIEVYNETGVLMMWDTESVTTGEVRGTITRDTTWRAATSPYTQKRGGVEVSNGATLTIKPRVTVNVGYDSKGSISVQGTLHADGALFQARENAAMIGTIIGFSHSNDSVIKNCVFDFGKTGCYKSIGAGYCDNLQIIGNSITCTRHSSTYDYWIISIASSDNSIISGNTVTALGYMNGIRSSRGRNNLIACNSISVERGSNDGGCIYLSDSYTAITKNTLNGRSIRVATESSDNMITHNTLSGGGIYAAKYWGGRNNSVISHNIIDGGSISWEGSNNIIKDNTVSGGIYLGSGSNNVIANNVVPCIGITIADNNMVENNIVSNARYSGIKVQGDNNTIKSNIVLNSSAFTWTGGIHVSGSNNRIMNNDVSNSSMYGISMDGSNNTIYNNIVSNTSLHGLYVEGSNNTIYNNIVSNSSGYGIKLWPYSSNVNLIYNNYFSNTKNAYDKYGDSIWNIEKTPGTNIVGGSYLGGNYWSDYTGTDADDDGLGDTPYDIEGGANKDYLPLIIQVLPVQNQDTLERFTTIQAAIDDPDTKDGHTIAVDPGYTEVETRENVVVNKKLTIKSSSGNPADTAIQALNPNEPVVKIVVDGVEIQGFTIKDATGEWGIWTEEGVVIRDAKVTNNGKGGIFSVKGDVLANNLEVEDNGGAGIVTRGGSGMGLILENIKVRNNKCDGISTLMDLTIKGTGNQVNGNAGVGIGVGGDKVDVKNIEVLDNGGWGIDAFRDIIIRERGVINNNAKGGIHTEEGSVSGDNLEITNNGGHGIDALTYLGSSVYLVNVKILHNKGPGIEMQGDLEIRGIGNQVNGNAGDGIGVGAGYRDGKVDVKNIEVLDNDGWGIDAFGDIVIRERGVINNNAKGGIRTEEGTWVRGVNLEITNNGGHGISAITGLGSYVHLDNVKILQNKGPGIVMQGDLEISGIGNQVNGNAGDGIGVDAGGDDGKVDVKNIEVLDNDGWGIDAFGDIVIRERGIINNNAKGGIQTYDGTWVRGVNLEITNNGGHGISAITGLGSSVHLDNVKILHNKGPGIEMQGDLEISGIGNQVNGNAGDGIGVGAGGGDGKVDVKNIEVLDNDGWGIDAFGDIIIRERGVINNNAKGGIQTYEGSVSGENLEITNNGGHGIDAITGLGSSVYLVNVKILHNKGPGIEMQGDLEIRGIGNQINGNAGDGIGVGAGGGDGKVDVKNIEVLDNDGWGILAEGNVDIRDAEITNNGNGGIRLLSSSHGTLTGNTISNNGGLGIYLTSCSDNAIYNNYFSNPNNAYDDGTNTWNIAKTAGTNIVGGPYLGGNYWSDYTGADLDEPLDGLGDTMLPYNSNGNIVNGGDYHPLIGPCCTETDTDGDCVDDAVDKCVGISDATNTCGLPDDCLGYEYCSWVHNVIVKEYSPGALEPEHDACGSEVYVVEETCVKEGITCSDDIYAYWNDPDDDDDGWCDEVCPTCTCCEGVDNCPDDWNPDQKDSDGDGIGDVCDETPFPVASVEIGKWVKYKAEPESEYRKAIDDAKVCNNVTFKIAVHNEGNGTNLTGIAVADVLNCSLGYIEGSASIPPTYANNCPDNQIFIWQFPGVWLEPCEYINITFDAHVDECGNDTNYACVKAETETGYSVSDEDTVWVNCTLPGTPVETATGTGIAYFATDAGTIEDLVAVDEATLPAEGKPALVFPHGFFSFDITGLTPGQTVVVTITLPDNVPVGTEYWKYHASEGGWIQIPMGSDDGDNVITITLVDGGLGDDDGTADGVIVDQGGPGLPKAAPNITSFAPPSPVNDTVCNWRTFNVTVNQTVNVSWYLNDSLLFTNESVTEANCTLHAEVVSEHNVSAIASNANGTDMQTWIWNVTETPPAPTVIKPNGGEEIPGGSVYDIKWNVTKGAYDLALNPITIYSSTDNGSSWTQIATNEPNDGKYSWNVPNINPSSSNCSVKVEAKDIRGNTGADTSDSTFTILRTDNSTNGTIPAGETKTVEGPPESNTTVEVTASGNVTVTVAYYGENPHPEAPKPAEMLDKYIDVAVSDKDNVTWPMYVRMNYTDDEIPAGVDESTLGLYYYKDGAWHRCGDTGVNTAENYVWANVTKDECAGSPFVSGEFKAPAPPNIFSFAPPSPVNDTVCTYRTFNVTVNQTVNVSWYLNNTHLFTNVSTKEANYTLHAEVIGEHNVSAKAENANGTDMQTWAWNVTAAPLPVLEINKTDNQDPVSPGGILNYSIRVNNTGNANATNVIVTETYDANVTFLDAVPAPSQGSDTWQFATLNVGETKWINISVTVNASVLNETMLHNIVNVTCDEGVSDSDAEDTTVLSLPVCIETATGTGIACFKTDAGTIEDLVAVDESTLPEEGKPALVFPHGFFSFDITGLTPGQTVIVTIQLPDNVPVGTEYWKYHASEGGWIQIPMGSDDGDKVITITLVDGGLGDDDGTANGVIIDQGGPGTPKPDLVITEKYETFVDGGSFNITYKVNNIGCADAGASNTTIYIDGVPLEVPTPAIPKGECHENTVGPFECPCGAILNVTVCADNYDEVDESNETNNCKENELECPGKPDLTVEKSVEIVDGTFIVSYTVTNNGDGPAGESTTCKYVDGVHIVAADQLCPALAPGESHSGTFGPEPCPCGATISVTIYADNYDDVAESDETNNYEVNWVECGLPDLEVTVTLGDGSFTADYTVTNTGVGPAGESTTCKYVDGVHLVAEDQPCPALAPGENHSGTFGPEPCPRGQTLNVTVCADNYDEVYESNETNNCKENELECPLKPDLVITDKWVCWPDSCTICYNVTNIGDGTAPACHNTTLYVDGVEVAHDHVPVDLAPGESHIGCFDDYTWTYTPPSDNITVCADNNKTIDELDEDNNCLTNIWMCGDVSGDGEVTMSDVRKVFNRYLDPNYPLDLPWAADVNGDGEVIMSDVRKVFNRYLDPSYDLNCRCKCK